jgi:hypothetical protein
VGVGEASASEGNTLRSSDSRSPLYVIESEFRKVTLGCNDVMLCSSLFCVELRTNIYYEFPDTALARWFL